MKYRELFKFEPIKDFDQLPDADLREGAVRAVTDCVISGGMAECLTRSVFPNLQIGVRGSGEAVLLVGSRGGGKTFWLSLISSIAEHADLAELNRGLDVLKVRGEGVGLDAIAGRFKVIRMEVDEGTKSFRDLLLARLKEYFSKLGVSHTFPAAPVPEGDGELIAGMMARFEDHFSGHGLLLVVDDLQDYLGSRTDKELLADVKFLGEIGTACRRTKLRFLASVLEPILDHEHAGVATDGLHGLKDRFAQVKMEARGWQHVVAGRLVKKTAAQKEAVRAYLTKFTGFYGGMQERMDEFVAQFPVHPDYIDICVRIPFAEAGHLLVTLSGSIEQLLDQTVPEDRPGLICFDSYWRTVWSTPEFRELPEVEAVIETAMELETRIKKCDAEPEHKAMALRLAYALFVHRLADGNIYVKVGPTPAELRDTLCLFLPVAAQLGNDPADDLLLFVMAILDLLKKLSKGKLIEYDPEHDRYYLRFARFRRFVKPELLLHWVNALPFLVLMLSGIVMLASRFWSIDHRTVARVVLTHKFFATIWVIGMPLVILMRPKVHWMHIKVVLTWGPNDLLWIVQSIRSGFDKKVVVPPAGRFNTGQKINAFLVIVYFFTFTVTGILIHFKGGTLLPWYIHAALFFSTMNTTGGHLFLAFINPGTRISLPGIFHGWSPMEYIEHHHPLSMPHSSHAHGHGHGDVHGHGHAEAHGQSHGHGDAKFQSFGRGEPVDATKTLREIFAVRAALVMLVLSVVMASFGAWAFHKGLATSAQMQFEKKFSSMISPRQLSTKHRMGASADRCTKCHSYTGGIPDSNCEKCHEIVKDHRLKGIGYHGTLKGNCFICHKEHPTGTNTLIPLVKETFNHKDTGFELDGKHAKLQCDECHKNKRTPETPGLYFMGLKHEACTDCHKDPHRGQFTVSCDKCHTPAGWIGKSLKFSHTNDSVFKLVGKHAITDCRKCHKPDGPDAFLSSAKFKGLTQECKVCHEEPHGQQFAAACTTCHSPLGWRKENLLFVHNKDTKFPLVAKHEAVACEKCHVPKAPGEHLGTAQFHNLKSECADCHKDPHRNQFERNCTKCHSPNGFKRELIAFVHNRDAKFQLIEKHAAAQCEKCHIPAPPEMKLASAQFRSLKSECVDCHKDPHDGQFERACAKCHAAPVEFSRKALQFEHAKDTKFPLIGKHAKVDCIKCHKPRPEGGKLASAQFRGLGMACETCHKVKHPEEYGATCVSCHSMEIMPKKYAGSDHILKYEANGEHITGKHLTAKCSSCHQPARIAQSGQVAKAGLFCVTCHKSDDPHKGALGEACTKCHGPEGWKGEHLRFEHDAMSRFGLDQDHRKMACTKCHDHVNWKTKGTTCADCHPKFYDKPKK